MPAKTPTAYQIVNWERFQHYSDRNPPWFKLYHEPLTRHRFESLPDTTKWAAIRLMIWVARNSESARDPMPIPNDPTWLQVKLGLEADPDLKALEDIGFLEPASTDASNHASTGASRNASEEASTGASTAASRDASADASTDASAGGGRREREGGRGKREDRGERAELRVQSSELDSGVLSSDATRVGAVPKPSTPATDLSEDIEVLGQFINELPAASSFSIFKAQEWAEAILMRCSLTLAEAKQLLPPFFAELTRRNRKPAYGWRIIQSGDLRTFLQDSSVGEALLGENHFDQPEVSDEELEQLRPVWEAIEQRRAELGRDGIRQRDTILQEAFAGAGLEYDPETHDPQLALLTRQELIRNAAQGDDAR